MQLETVRHVSSTEASEAVVRAIARLEGSDTTQQRHLDAAQRELVVDISNFLQQAVRAQGPAPHQTGVYVHGPAGRGKSLIMSELFHAADLPEAAKRRLHLHDFFRSFQQQSAAHGSAREAIDRTLEELLEGARLFYFDELPVRDPGSGALLNRLLAELVARRIPVLITSNYVPEELLPNPVYHPIVEASVDAIRQHVAVRALDGETTTGSSTQ